MARVRCPQLLVKKLPSLSRRFRFGATREVVAKDIPICFKKTPEQTNHFERSIHLMTVRVRAK
jgi:hypothetical protein